MAALTVTGPSWWRRREVVAPALVLFTVMVAHTILETARDALFLVHLGPDRLAWAYLAIAGSAMLAVTAVRTWAGVRDPRRVLLGFMMLAVVGTAVLATTIDRARIAVFVLYVWTGLVATLVVPSFWTLLDRSLRVTQAKRVFAVIAAGGTVGAMLGSAIAALLGSLFGARHLVTVGAIAFGVAAVVAAIAAPDSGPVVAVVRRDVEDTVSRRSRHYIRILVVLGVLSTIALTLGDLTFKRALAERISGGDLVMTFGAIYAGLNVLALVVQIVITPRALTTIGVGDSMLVLPVILTLTAMGFGLSGALVAIVMLKLGDGGLRHSLHRVASEILFLPVPAAVRDGAKPLADALGQRGGQAVAALLAMGLAAAWADTRTIALATAVVAMSWLAWIAVARRAYVRQFRDTLRIGELQRDVQVPALDAESVEVLLESLASPDEHEALAALDLLGGRGGRIPTLVLYHPSAAVVRTALAQIRGTDRGDVIRVLERLIEHGDPQIRASALLAAAQGGLDDDRVRAALGHRDLEVRAAAHVALHARGVDLGDALHRMIDEGVSARLAIVHAIGFAPGAWAKPLLDVLLSYREPSVMRRALRVLAEAPDLVELPRVLGLLADPHVRGEARRVFTAIGDRGLAALVEALDDPRVPREVRRHVPRTISRFKSQLGIRALVARLPREPDGTTEFKILRALGRMRAQWPMLEVDVRTLRGYVRRSLADSARYTLLLDHLASSSITGTADTELLRELLADKRRFAIEHVFRGLGVLDPRAGMRSVHAAMTGRDDVRHAAAREIVEQLLPLELRGPLFALFDDLTLAERRTRLGAFAIRPIATHEELVATLLEDPSESLRCIAAHHVAERGLTVLRADLARLRAITEPPLVVQAFDQAIARLDA